MLSGHGPNHAREPRRSEPETGAMPAVGPAGTDGFYEAVVHQMAVAFVVTDLEYTIRAWSRGAERLLGYTAAEVVGLPQSMLVPPDLMESAEAGIRRRAERGEAVLEFATERLHKDGRRIPVEIFRSPVRSAGGTSLGYSTVILDQSDKLAMQEKLLQAERLVALARVVGKVFHELRTPLGVLVLEAEILGEEVEDLIASAGDRAKPAAAARVRDSLNLFMREIQRIEGLAEDYLLMIRPIRPHRSPVRLGDFLDSLVRELESHSHREGYRVRLECPDRDSEVLLDSMQMLRVFHNLASNSLDAIPEATPPILNLDARFDHDRLVIRLRDNGPGLPPELVGGGAFEIFTTTKRLGSGLGLHLVQEIVLAHGGTIDLRNHPEGGAEAVVSIPRTGETGDV